MPSLNTKLATAPNVSANYVLKATTSTTIGNSLIYDDGTNVGIGTSSPSKKLEIVSNTSQDGIKISGSSNPRLTIIDTTNSVQFDALTTDTEAVLRTDTNHPLVLSTNGTARLTISSTGNVGIGTTSPSYKLHIIESTTNGRAVQGVATATSGTNYGAVLVAEGIGATKNIGLYASAEGATTNVAAIFDKGNVGIGTSSPSQKLEVYAGASDGVKINALDVPSLFLYAQSGTVKNWGIAATNLVAGDFGIYQSNSNGGNPITAGTSRLYITSGGEVLIGGTSTTGSGLTIYNSSVGGTGTEIRCTATSGNNVVMYARMGVSGTTSNYFFAAQDNTQDKIYIYGNGNIVNRNNSYGTLSSDIKLKQDIVDANSQWDDIKNLRVVNFRYIDDVERDGEAALKQIGFIAQEVEQVSPSLVYETKSPESEDTWKSIKTSIIHLKALKALQEAMAKIEELETKLQDQQQTINSLINR